MHAGVVAAKTKPRLYRTRSRFDTYPGTNDSVAGLMDTGGTRELVDNESYRSRSGLRIGLAALGPGITIKGC